MLPRKLIARWISPALSVTLALVAVACGCVLTSPGNSAEEPATGVPPAKVSAAKDPGPRVADPWQQKMIDLLASSQATEAWGLFSTGGWSNAGQVMVLLSKDRKTKDVHVVPANKTKMEAILPKRSLAAKELADLETAMARAPSLKDVDVESFDGLEFELVRAEKGADGKPKVTYRVYVRDPGDKPHPEHAAVFGAFERLRKTPKAPPAP